MFWFGLATPAVQRRYFTVRLLADRRVPELGVYTDRFMLHLFVALAEKERAISRRTRDALAAAKARGVQLVPRHRGFEFVDVVLMLRPAWDRRGPFWREPSLL